MAGDVETGGGASINGTVSTNGGGFSGRDSQRNDTRIEIQNQVNDYRFIQLDTKITNIQAEMINRFIALDGHCDATQERHNAVHDELRQEIRRMAKSETMPVVGPPPMQIVLAILMTILIILMMYGVWKINVAVDKITLQNSQIEQRTALDMR